MLRGAGAESDCSPADVFCGTAEDDAKKHGSLGFRMTGPQHDGEDFLLPRDNTFSELLKAPREVHPAVDAKTLIAKFAAHDASLALVREGKAAVPRIFLASLPPDLPELDSVRQRKAAFITTVLPLILHANQKILAQRRQILAIQKVRQIGLDEGDEARKFLAAMAEEYDVAADNLPALLHRVDVVPPSQALAQAAEESGWGTSRFARRGNAVFGQRTFKEGRGMVPLERAEGERHEVLVFNSLQTSVDAYLWNLNTHFAYREFRRLRARQRKAGQPLDGYALIGTMLRYSERGADYVKTIRAIMRVNELDQFDRARLAEGGRLINASRASRHFTY